MKKLLLLSCISNLTSCVFSQTVSFIDNDWGKARVEAKEKRKYLFVDAYTDWCSWCKVMDQKTFPDKTVADFMNSNFVALKMEMEHNYGINVAMKYQVSAFPSFLIFHADGKLVRKMMGYMEAEKFLEELKSSVDVKKYPPLEGISEVVDVNFPDFYKKAYGGKGIQKSPEVSVVNDFLDKQDDLLSEVSYRVMIRFAGLLSENYRNQLFDNQPVYEKLFGEGDIDNAVFSIQNKLVSNAIKNKSEADLQTAINFAEKHSKQEDFLLTTRIKLSYYRGVGDWLNMSKSADFLIEKEGYKSNIINDWSWTIYESCDDTLVINKALGWLNQTVNDKSDYPILDTYAALLYKGKQFADAKKMALRAIETGKANGEKVDDTEKLLEKIEKAM